MDMFTAYGGSLEAQQSITADLPASIEVTPFELLERELASERVTGELSTSHTYAWLLPQQPRLSFLIADSACHALSALSPVPFASGAALSLYSDHFTTVTTDRLQARIAELMDLVSGASEGQVLPTADPQAVDLGWLDSLQSVRSRESSDLAAWYASMDEE